MMPPADPWVCRIPRPLLHDLAATAQLQGRERVLLAVMSELYSHRDGGEGATSLPRLERLTRMHRRSVRRALLQLQADGVLIVTGASPGQMKRWRLTGCAPVAHPAQGMRTPEPESAHPSDQKRASHPAQGVRRVPGANGAHPSNESRNDEFLKTGKPDQGPQRNDSAMTNLGPQFRELARRMGTS
jgi:hypothetical protein